MARSRMHLGQDDNPNRGCADRVPIGRSGVVQVNFEAHRSTQHDLTRPHCLQQEVGNVRLAWDDSEIVHHWFEPLRRNDEPLLRWVDGH